MRVNSILTHISPAQGHGAPPLLRGHPHGPYPVPQELHSFTPCGQLPEMHGTAEPGVHTWSQRQPPHMPPTHTDTPLQSPAEQYRLCPSVQDEDCSPSEPGWEIAVPGCNAGMR
jgi:hypothetical protein